MGIKFRCHACDKKLHVKAFLAGKRGVCPRCGAKVRIPHESQVTARATSGKPAVGEHAVATSSGAPSAALTEATSADAVAADEAAPQPTTPQPAAAVVDPIAEAPDVVWYVRPPSGGEYGPASGEIMQRWLDEGRVSSDSAVWREGWSDWREAGGVFPKFATSSVPASATAEPAMDPQPVPIAPETPSAVRRRTSGSGRRGGKRPIATIAIMSVISVILLVILVIVLQTQ